jgi:symplekin
VFLVSDGSFLVAIGICFSMTDVFRSEILAVVMQQILDEPVLPTLFMRTVSFRRSFVIRVPKRLHTRPFSR